MAWLHIQPKKQGSRRGGCGLGNNMKMRVKQYGPGLHEIRGELLLLRKEAFRESLTCY